MGHSTTTFRRIVALYDEERQLLDKTELTDAERARFADIRASLIERYWPQERAERVRQASGPPRLISAPDPRSHRRVAQFAHGMQPLPSGGD